MAQLLQRVQDMYVVSNKFHVQTNVQKQHKVVYCVTGRISESVAEDVSLSET